MSVYFLTGSSILIGVFFIMGLFVFIILLLVLIDEIKKRFKRKAGGKMKCENCKFGCPRMCFCVCHSTKIWGSLTKEQKKRAGKGEYVFTEITE